MSREQDIRRRASGWVRTLVVASGTLAILLVCFSIYQYSQVDPQVAAPPREPVVNPARLPPVVPREGSVTEVPSGVDVGGGRIGPGEKIQLTIYDSGENRARMEIEVADWTPAYGADNEFALTEPQIRLRTKNGHAVRVTARRGILEAQRKRGGGLDPQRGKLTGDVVIQYDRLSESDRAKLPQERRDRLDPSDLIEIRMDEVEFDLEYSKVTVPGALHLSARDAELYATDLEMRFNEAQNRVEYMRISGGGRLKLRGESVPLAPAIPGKEAKGESRMSIVEWLYALMQEKAAAQQEPVETEKRAASRPRIEFTSEGVPVFNALEEDVKTPKRAIRYHIHLEGNVDARQFTGNAMRARLEADTLEIIREFSQQDRLLGESSPGDSTPEDRQAPGHYRTSSLDSHVVITWRERMVVEACSPGEARCAGDTRSRIIAGGAPAKASYPEGIATFDRAAFDPHGSETRLYGSEIQPVVVSYADRWTITGLSVQSKRDGDEITIRVTGPGTLTRKDEGFGTPGQGVWNASGVPSTIEFGKELLANGRFVTRMRIDPTGRITSREVRVLDRASFIGRVKMRRGKSRLSADAVTATFTSRPSFFSRKQYLEHLAAQGHVEISRQSDRVSCREIDIVFGKDRNDHAGPRVATALGNVVAEQEGGATIQARDKLIVDFETLMRSPLPADGAEEPIQNRHEPHPVPSPRLVPADQPETEPGATSALGLPQRIGTDTAPGAPDTLNETVVKRLRAFGEVIVSDPAQALEVTAETLDCTVVKGREIETAIVRGMDDRPASIRLEALTVVGPVIKLNLPDQWAEVPSAGRMTFLSDKDLDGRRVAEPIPISVTWNNGMKYQGRRNRCVFSGEVHATSQTTTTFDCDRLLVEFDDVRAVADRAGDSQPRGPKPSDRTEPRASARPVSREPNDAEPGVLLDAPKPAAQDWGGMRVEYWSVLQEIVDLILPPSSREETRPTRRRFSKEPVYILATGNAVALTSQFDPISGALENRARISGPKLSVNLRPEVSKMMIEGPGNLLLEDNRPPGDGERDSESYVPPPVGLFGVDENTGPSNTLIEWDELMWYDFSSNQTRFEGNVSLKHFSGSELMRIRRGLVSHGEDVPSGRATFLTCDVLTVDFLNRDERSQRSAGRRMGRLSADRLKRFQASGEVVLQDRSEGLSVTADRLVFWKDRNLLGIYGSPRRMAWIVIQKPGQLPSQLKTERLFYELGSGKLELAKAAIQTR